MKIYKVGGAVRDQLLGNPVKDNDWVVVGATTADLEALGYRKIGRDFPVFLHPDTKEEYALARTERKTAPGYTGFEVNASTTVTLEEDLLRRDLTINAIAQDLDGKLIDPFDGQADLEQGILRHISPAFAEDPLRLLRVARFAARFDFAVAPETLELMQAITDSGELDALVPERIWSEWQRALTEPKPGRFFEVLRSVGALAKIFPELEGLFGVPQPEKYHPEIDTGVHTMMVLEQAVVISNDPIVRFAALMHDLGKGTTPPEEWPSHKGHEERSAELIDNVCDRHRIPNEYRELAILVARFHTHCHKVTELRAATLMDTLAKLDALRRPERFESYLLTCEADARGRLGLETEPYPQADHMRRALATAQAITGADLAAAGLSGEVISAKLRRQRIKALKEIATGD